MTEFAPRLDILPAPQRRPREEFRQTPPAFTLDGGTAIALHLAHRRSVDFDFFTTADFSPEILKREVPHLPDGEVSQRAENTLTARVNRGGWVLLSFPKPPALKPFAPPLAAADTGLTVAALIELAGLKADLVQQRAQAKDFLDLDALFWAGISLVDAMAAARILHGDDCRPEITLKALSCFGDGALASLSPTVRKRILKAVAGADVRTIPAAVSALRSGYGRHGP